MRRTHLFLLLLVSMMFIPHQQVSSERIRNTWTEVQYQDTVLMGENWFVDIRMTNKTVLLAGYTISVDGIVVNYEYFPNLPARGSFVVAYTFEGIRNTNSTLSFAEGDHTVLLILLPFENSLYPQYFEDIYEFDVTLEQVLEGKAFAFFVILFIIPIVALILYIMGVKRANSNRIENINALNYIPFKFSRWQQDTDSISLRELRMIERRYDHYDEVIDNLIRKHRPMGVLWKISTVFLVGMVMSTIVISIIALVTKPDILVGKAYVSDDIPAIPFWMTYNILLISTSMGMSGILANKFNARFSNHDILIDPQELLEECKKDVPCFIESSWLTEELSDLDDAVITMKKVRSEMTRILVTENTTEMVQTKAIFPIKEKIKPVDDDQIIEEKSDVDKEQASVKKTMIKKKITKIEVKK